MSHYEMSSHESENDSIQWNDLNVHNSYSIGFGIQSSHFLSYFKKQIPIFYKIMYNKKM